MVIEATGEELGWGIFWRLSGFEVERKGGQRSELLGRR